MLLCGAEEPVGPNAQLYALNEDTDRIELSTFGIASASRYSFLWLGPPTDASAAFTAVLRDILLRHGDPLARAARLVDRLP